MKKHYQNLSTSHENKLLNSPQPMPFDEKRYHNDALRLSLKRERSIERYCSRSFFAFMDHCKVVYIIWTLKPVNNWIPPQEMDFFSVGVCDWFQFLKPSEIKRTIHDLDNEIAVFKLSSIEHAQNITFLREILTLFFVMNIYKTRKGTRAGVCCE